jgi:ADP-heptose:LPS heptosyltransferase
LILRTDCRHFPGDRPCKIHKETGILCAGCGYYVPRGRSILIVKLDALGDVLRTTCILPSLHRAHGDCYVTWLTSNAAVELLEGNQYIQEVLTPEARCLPTLLTRQFDIVINPDASPLSCEIATIARAGERFGFTIRPNGTVEALNNAAQRWLTMGACDALKRNNEQTYQQVIHEICELDPAGQHIVLNLTDDERRQEHKLVSVLGLPRETPVVGINAGAGERWALKKWRSEGFTELISGILETTDANVLLLGGPDESGLNAEIAGGFTGRVFDAGPGNLRRFLQIVDLCDLIVTGDTLALHVALGLRKRVVALFGPTSHREIDIYGLGSKVVSPIECTACYRRTCDRKPNCMDLISVEEVLDSVLAQCETLTCQATT